MFVTGFWFLSEEDRQRIDACGETPRNASTRHSTECARLRRKRDEWKNQEKVVWVKFDDDVEDLVVRGEQDPGNVMGSSERLQVFAAALLLRKVHFKRSWADVELELASHRLIVGNALPDLSIPSTRETLLTFLRAHASYDTAFRAFEAKICCARCGWSCDGSVTKTFACANCRPIGKRKTRVQRSLAVRMYRTTITCWAEDVIRRHGPALRRRTGMYVQVPNRMTSYRDGSNAAAQASLGPRTTVIDFDLYTDAFTVSAFSRQSITVFYARAKNFAPHLRETNLIAVIDGATILESYDLVIRDWVDELTELGSNGINIGDWNYRVRMHSVLGDAPALRKLTAFKGGSFVNRVFCTQCDATRPQERIERNQHESGDEQDGTSESETQPEPEGEEGDAPPRGDPDRGRDAGGNVPRFIELGERRNAARILADGRHYLQLRAKDREAQSKATGHRYSALYALPNFSVVTQAPCDTMHMLCHGIAQDILKELQPALEKKRSEVRLRMEEVTNELPSTYTRCTLDGRKTAAWYRALFLHYLPVILEFAPEVLSESLVAFRDIMHVVSDVCPKRDDVDRLRERARFFVDSWTRTANVRVVRGLNFHALLHVRETLLEGGPGCETSCWVFEAAHQSYKGIKTNNVNLPKQLTEQDADAQRSAEILFRLLRNSELEDVREHARVILAACGYCDEIASDHLSSGDIRGDADIDGGCATLLRVADTPELHPVRAMRGRSHLRSVRLRTAGRGAAHDIQSSMNAEHGNASRGVAARHVPTCAPCRGGLRATDPRVPGFPGAGMDRGDKYSSSSSRIGADIPFSAPWSVEFGARVQHVFCGRECSSGSR